MLIFIFPQKFGQKVRIIHGKIQYLDEPKSGHSPGCLSSGQWTYTVWYTHVMDNYLFLTGSEALVRDNTGGP